MKRIFQLVLFITLPFISISQSVPTEVMIGNRNFWYQHSFNFAISKNKKIGVFNTHSLHFFNDNTKQEVMSQTYLNYKLSPWLKINAGVFYVTKPGINPSVSLHIFKKTTNTLLLIVPRIDVYKNPSYDVMSMIEYKPIIRRVQLYTRIQTLFSFKEKLHARSYQNIRVGISNKNLQYGFAVNFDAYGSSYKYYSNYGFFIRKEITF